MANVHFMFILADGDTKHLKDGNLGDETVELQLGDLLVWLSMDDTQKRVTFPAKTPFTGLVKDIVLPRGKPAKISKVRDNAVPPHTKETFEYSVKVERLKARPLVGPDIIVDGGEGLRKKKKKAPAKAKR